MAENTNEKTNNGEPKNQNTEKVKDTRTFKEKWSDWKEGFVENHPKATRRLAKARDMGVGAVAGGAAVFGALAYMGMHKDDGSAEIPTTQDDNSSES